MRVRDFEDEGEHASLALHEKGCKDRRIACHHEKRYVTAYPRTAEGGKDQKRGWFPRCAHPLPAGYSMNDGGRRGSGLRT
jgi:hypothetical protein